MAGFAMMGNPYRASSGIITSTPAIGKIANPTHDGAICYCQIIILHKAIDLIADFLAVPADDDEEESMQEEELLSRYKPKEEPVDTFKASGFMQVGIRENSMRESTCMDPFLKFPKSFIMLLKCDL